MKGNRGNFKNSIGRKGEMIPTSSRPKHGRVASPSDLRAFPPTVEGTIKAAGDNFSRRSGSMVVSADTTSVSLRRCK